MDARGHALLSTPADAPTGTTAAPIWIGIAGLFVTLIIPYINHRLELRRRNAQASPNPPHTTYSWIIGPPQPPPPAPAPKSSWGRAILAMLFTLMLTILASLSAYIFTMRSEDGNASTKPSTANANMPTLGKDHGASSTTADTASPSDREQAIQDFVVSYKAGVATQFSSEYVYEHWTSPLEFYQLTFPDAQAFYDYIVRIRRERIPNTDCTRSADTVSSVQELANGDFLVETQLNWADPTFKPTSGTAYTEWVLRPSTVGAPYRIVSLKNGPANKVTAC